MSQIDIINIQNKVGNGNLRKHLHDIGNTIQRPACIVGDFNISLTLTEPVTINKLNTLCTFMNTFDLAKINIANKHILRSRFKNNNSL